MAVHLDLIVSRKFYVGIEIRSVECGFLAVHHIQSGILLLFNAPIAQTGLKATQSAASGECSPRSLPGLGRAAQAVSAALRGVLRESSAPHLARTVKQKYVGDEGYSYSYFERRYIRYSCTCAHTYICTSEYC